MDDKLTSLAQSTISQIVKKEKLSPAVRSCYTIRTSWDLSTQWLWRFFGLQRSNEVQHSPASFDGNSETRWGASGAVDKLQATTQLLVFCGTRPVKRFKPAQEISKAPGNKFLENFNCRS